MNYPGQDVKFMVESQYENLILLRDWFEIDILDRYGRVRKHVDKADCFYDMDGRFYFTMEKVKKGIYYARFHGTYEDEDYDDQVCNVIDYDYLFSVVYCGCPCKDSECPSQVHKVKYTQVDVVSVDGEDYLCDCYGRYIYTSDGKRIAFKSAKDLIIENMTKVKMQMTGEEFLQKWEGRSQDGKIDTVPELFDSLTGIDDKTTVSEKIDEETAITYDEENEGIRFAQRPPVPNTGDSTSSN
jgi:hypothetical protein